jgi:hypothetical protein
MRTDVNTRKTMSTETREAASDQEEQTSTGSRRLSCWKTDRFEVLFWLIPIAPQKATYHEPKKFKPPGNSIGKGT